MSRPALPRASSAMSGFFFCGSIDEPVLYASARRRKPNSSLVHSTISSPRRDRWTCVSAATNSASATKSRSDTASSELSKRRANPSSAAVLSGSSGQARARERTGTERRHVGARRSRRATARRRVRRPRSARGSGGRAAPAGRAAGGCSRGGRRPPPTPRAPSSTSCSRWTCAATAVPSRRRNSRSAVATWSLRLRPVCSLAPAAPASSVTRRSMAVWMSSSDGSEHERAVGELAFDAVERGEHLVALVVGEQADAGQHGDVRAGAREVVGREPPVERQALGEREQLVGGTVGEAAVPEGHARRALSAGTALLARPTSPPTGPTGARSRRSPRGGSVSAAS